MKAKKDPEHYLSNVPDLFLYYYSYSLRSLGKFHR